MANELKVLDKDQLAQLWTKCLNTFAQRPGLDPQVAMRNLYNLGVYDSYVDNNDGTITITRQTGYVDLGSLNYTSSSSAWYSGDYITLIAKDSRYNMMCANYTTVNVESLVNLGVNQCSVDSGGYIQVKTSSASLKPSGLAQIKLSTSYTEKVIKNQPLNTLNASGSAWLQNEYDKTIAQIWDEEWKIGQINPTTGAEESGSRVISVNYIPIEPNTNYSTTSDDIGIVFYNSSKTIIGTLQWYSNHFTTPSNACYMKFHLAGGYGQIYKADIMISKGTNVISYNRNSGKIIHYGDNNPVILWVNGNPYTSFDSGYAPILDSSKYKYLIVGFMINSANVQATQYFKIQNRIGRTAYLSLTDNTSATLYHRGMKINSNTQIEFQGGYTNSTYDNSCCIPTIIYGTNIL